MSNYFNITGVREGVNGNIVPIRQEIRSLHPDMMNIYLLGLQRMQSLPKTDRLSWFQIAGIHGRPYAPWDNVRGNGNSGGYCTHSSILFLTWHRPYLALFEVIPRFADRELL
jgi:tyrosinase